MVGNHSLKLFNVIHLCFAMLIEHYTFSRNGHYDIVMNEHNLGYHISSYLILVPNLFASWHEDTNMFNQYAVGSHASRDFVCEYLGDADNLEQICVFYASLSGLSVDDFNDALDFCSLSTFLPGSNKEPAYLWHVLDDRLLYLSCDGVPLHAFDTANVVSFTHAYLGFLRQDPSLDTLLGDNEQLISIMQRSFS